MVAIVKGQEWGWGSPAILALLAVTARGAAGDLVALGAPRSPIVEPAMLRVRSFGLAVGASVLFFAGFGAMLLAGVLFLTGVWHESVLTAGLMLFPGPAMATAFSVPSARLGARVGYRIPGVLGALLFVAGQLFYITQTGDTPAYRPEYLPGIAISGAGVGLMIPTLTGAGASSLAPERFATGAAVLTMGRQIGAALGVALLVAVLGTSASERLGLPFGVADQRRRRAHGRASRWRRSAAGRCSKRCRGGGAALISESIADPLIAECGGSRW